MTAAAATWGVCRRAREGAEEQRLTQPQTLVATIPRQPADAGCRELAVPPEASAQLRWQHIPCDVRRAEGRVPGDRAGRIGEHEGGREGAVAILPHLPLDVAVQGGHAARKSRAIVLPIARLGEEGASRAS